MLTLDYRVPRLAQNGVLVGGGKVRDYELGIVDKHVSCSSIRRLLHVLEVLFGGLVVKVRRTVVRVGLVRRVAITLLTVLVVVRVIGVVRVKKHLLEHSRNG